MPVDKILAHIKDEHYLKWLSGSPEDSGVGRGRNNKDNQDMDDIKSRDEYET